nr:tol-Pal system protein TolA-like [Aegilops tauschii subsp. strangulata]
MSGSAAQRPSHSSTSDEKWPSPKGYFGQEGGAYQAPEKTAKKKGKETRSGLRRKASAKDAEVSELQRKQKLADDEIDCINKRFDEAQGTATQVETLKSTLAEAKEEARASKAAADKVAADLEAEQVTRRKCEARVTEVEQVLQDAANKCGALQEQNKAQAAEIAKALQEDKEARSESRAAREEIKQAEK